MKTETNTAAEVLVNIRTAADRDMESILLFIGVLDAREQADFWCEMEPYGVAIGIVGSTAKVRIGKTWAQAVAASEEILQNIEAGKTPAANPDFGPRRMVRSIPESLRKMTHNDFRDIFGDSLPRSLFARDMGRSGHIYGYTLNDDMSEMEIELLNGGDAKLVSIHVGKALAKMAESVGIHF